MADAGGGQAVAKGAASLPPSSSASESAAHTPPSRNQSSGQHSQVAEVAGIQTPEKVKPLTSPTARGWGFFPPSIFVGTWTDSLGNSIVVTDSVRASQQCLLVKMSKPGRVLDLEIWPRQFSQKQWTWVCGNGSLDWWSSSKGMLWWVTFDGRWSRWDKRKEPEASVQVQSSQSPKHVESQPEPVAVSPPIKDTESQPEPVAASSPTVVEGTCPSMETQTAQVLPVPDTGCLEKDQAPPPKRIERVLNTWHVQDPSQMNVIQGEFVDVWVGTETEQGWIYAERRGSDTQAGWVPKNNLKPLPDQHRWMMTKRTWHAKDESQCSINEDSIVMVWTDSRTAEGWVYVTSSQDSVEESEGGKMGWVPVVCLEWEEVS